VACGLPDAHRLAVVAEPELHRTARQRQRLQKVIDVRELGALGAHELLARGHVVEQVTHFHAGARRMLRGARGLQLAAVHLDAERGLGIALARGEREARHRGHRRQRLAAEAHAGHVFEVVEAADLAGGVRGHRQRQLVGRDAAAVVAHADQPRAALIDVHLDARGAGVEAVLHQFLDHGRGAFDHLAGGDLVDEFGGQRTDDGHPRTLAVAPVASPRGGDQPAGIASTVPVRTTLLSLWFALFSAPMLMPYWRAMLRRLSPSPTRCRSRTLASALAGVSSASAVVGAGWPVRAEANSVPLRRAAWAANQVPIGGLDSK